MTRVLVTGATGFIGRHAVAELVARGHEVHAVARRAGKDAGGARWHAADLLEPGAGEALVRAVEPEALLHLAWYAEPGAFWEAAENVRWVEASLALARAFTAAGGRRLVAAGTCAEYDWSAGTCVEDVTPLAPRTLYGRAKHALETVLTGMGLAEPELDVAWGRVFFLYGPGEDPRRLVASIAGALARGEPAPVSEGTQRRDFLHVADVARAFAALVDSDVTGRVNIGSGDAVPVRRIAELLGELTGRGELLRVGAIPTRPHDPPLIEAAVGRLRDEVGFTPRLDLEAGLRDTLGQVGEGR